MNGNIVGGAKMSEMRKKIKIDFVDFWPGFYKKDNIFSDLLNQKYDIEISDHPDYLFTSIYGKQAFLKYDCIRICFIGENLRPNFDFFDYAMGFDWISFEDRYQRLPLYRMYGNWPELSKRRHITLNELKEKTKFCNFVYSNAKVKNRDQFYNLLSQYKKIDSGGRYMNNIGGPVKDKCAFQTMYKFSIAFENSSMQGYTTEKITDAFAAYTIPIYWGNPEIVRDFNPASFINCHDFSNFDAVIDYIEKIDNDDDAYLSMINQPIFNDNKVPEYLTNKAIFAFLDNIFSQDLDKASRRPANICFRWPPYKKYMKREHNGLLKRLKQVLSH